MENNLEDEALSLEHLEAELLGDDDGDLAIVEMQTSTSNVPNAPTLPLSSQPPSLCGGCVAVGSGSRPLLPTQYEDSSTPSSHRSRE